MVCKWVVPPMAGWREAYVDAHGGILAWIEPVPGSFREMGGGLDEYIAWQASWPLGSEFAQALGKTAIRRLVENHPHLK